MPTDSRRSRRHRMYGDGEAGTWKRGGDPVCGEDSCAACEQTTCRPADEDCDGEFTGSAAALMKAAQEDCDDRDGSDESHRTTQVHNRFQLIGGWSEDHLDGELIEAHQTKADALADAVNNLRPNRYGWVEVFDTMARRGQPCRWDETGKVIGREKGEST